MHEKFRAARRLKEKPDRLRKTAGGIMTMVGIVLLSADPTTASVKAYIMTELAALALIIAGVTLAKAWIRRA